MNRSGQEVQTFSPGGRQREVSAASLEKNARPRHNLLRLHQARGKWEKARASWMRRIV